jgi:hypothetical protein
MTTAYTILFAICLLGLGAFALVVMLDHGRKRRDRHVLPLWWSRPVDGPAVRASLWNGGARQVGDADTRRLDGPSDGLGTAPREGWARGA